MAPPNIFFLPNSKLFFAQMGKNTDPFLAIFFCPTKNLTAAMPLQNTTTYSLTITTVFYLGGGCGCLGVWLTGLGGCWKGDRHHGCCWCLSDSRFLARLRGYRSGCGCGWNGHGSLRVLSVAGAAIHAVVGAALLEARVSTLLEARLCLADPYQ